MARDGGNVFFDPAKTGLILLGASQFSEDADDNNRAVFHRAQAAVEAFFRTPRTGFGLQQTNILNAFDHTGPKSVLTGRIESFLEARRYEDLFVYICSHGIPDGNFFCFRLHDSEDGNPDSFYRFALLDHQITSLTGGRVYYLIDACYSGLAHGSDWEAPRKAGATNHQSGQPFPMTDIDLLPSGGATLLTSNSPETVGLVVADDRLELPLFTQELINVLRNGVEGGEELGLTFSQLQRELDRRVVEALPRISDWRDGMPRSDTPCCTNSIRNERGGKGQLSHLYVFQNNHWKFENTNKQARRIRAFYGLVERKNDRILRIEAERGQLQGELSGRAKVIAELQERLAAAETARDTLKSERDGLVKDIESHQGTLSKAVAACYMLTLLALVLLSALGVLLYFRQEILSLTVGQAKIVSTVSALI